MKTVKFTTVALDRNQHLVGSDIIGTDVEKHCIGYTDGRRDKKLDGYYFRRELKAITKATL